MVEAKPTKETDTFIVDLTIETGTGILFYYVVEMSKCINERYDINSSE